MSKQSIALHSRLTADASGMIAEFKRADNEVRRSTSGMRAEIGSTMKMIGRQLSLPNLTRGILSGFGVGSGIQLVGTVMDIFAERWKESEQFAAKLEERSKAIADLMREVSQEWGKIYKENLPPEKRRDSINQEIAKIAGQRDQAMDDRLRALRGFQWVEEYSKKYSAMQIQSFEGEDFRRGGIAIPKREFTDIMGKRLDEAQTKWAELNKKLQPLVREVISLNNEITKSAEKSENEAAEKTKKREEERKELQRIEEKHWSDSAQKAFAELAKAREAAGQREFDRWSQAGRVNVDSMMKRGMSLGGDYKSWNDVTNNILSQILETARKAVAEMKANPLRYAD